MAFRANEAAASEYESVKKYLIPRDFSPEQRMRSEEALREIVAICGPAVDAYPTWHPLVAGHTDRHPWTYPTKETGYEGLDHTRLFVNGFVTCPYDDGDRVIRSAGNIDCPPGVRISAERLAIKFYSESATAILVRCEWDTELEPDFSIPKRIAIPLMLEKELPCWRWAERAETWETMRPYLLGEPHGRRSSLFVNQDTAVAMKRLYESLVDSGMFGPVK
jgi:hypothetical protein